MLAITHGLAAGLIVTKISPPYLSYPLAFIAHLLTDEIPHWDFGTVAKRKLNRYIPLGTIDLILAILSCWLVFQKGKVFNPILWGGVFFGLLPDFIQAGHSIFGFNPPIIRRLDKFHNQRPHQHPGFIKGLIPQIIIVGLAILLR